MNALATVVSSLHEGVRAPVRWLWRKVEHGFDAAFGSTANPLRQLGSVAVVCFALLAVSGVILYAVLDTSVQGAHASIAGLADVPWHLGTLLRGLHRYAADAFVIVIVLHLVREWAFGHERGARRYPWLTGLPLVALVMVCAVGGFWLNWDRLGQFSAQATAEWLDVLPLLATPLSRNFLSDAAVNDRLFSLLVFIHLGVPLLLVFGLWFHIQRLTRPMIFPARRLSVGLTLSLLALALVVPVLSHEPASMASVPQSLRLDWILLFLHPITDATSATAVWLSVGALAALGFALPYLPQRASLPVAQVDPDNCNGCRRCFVDCPFAAISMVSHPNQRVGRELAVVDADLCTGCGICAGACPSSSPFRGAATLVSGIDMPGLRVGELRQRVQRELAACAAPQPLVVFGCAQGARATDLGPDVCRIELLCAGQLPPSFVEYALRDGAAGVLVSGCREGGCEYRFGQTWTEERLRGLREPYLRASVEPNRVATAWVDEGDDHALRGSLARLRANLPDGVDSVSTSVSPHG